MFVDSNRNLQAIRKVRATNVHHEQVHWIFISILYVNKEVLVRQWSILEVYECWSTQTQKGSSEVDQVRRKNQEDLVNWRRGDQEDRIEKKIKNLIEK